MNPYSWRVARLSHTRYLGADTLDILATICDPHVPLLNRLRVVEALGIVKKRVSRGDWTATYHFPMEQLYDGMTEDDYGCRNALANFYGGGETLYDDEIALVNGEDYGIGDALANFYGAVRRFTTMRSSA